MSVQTPQLFMQGLQLLVITGGLAFTYKQFWANRAAGMMARFSGKDYQEARANAEVFFSELRSLQPQERVQKCLDICQRSDETRAKLFGNLHAIGMFFSEIGVCLRSPLCWKREFYIFDRLVPYYWLEMAPFVIACHQEFGFPLDAELRLDRQPALVLFENFRQAYLILEKSQQQKVFCKPGSSPSVTSTNRSQFDQDAEDLKPPRPTPSQPRRTDAQPKCTYPGPWW